MAATLAGGGEDSSACSTPFASAPSSPSRDPSFSAAAAGGFYSAPASPARGAGPGAAGDDEYGFGFDFDFSSQFPSPVASALPMMSSADELFHNGQIRPMRLSSLLLRPQAPPPLAGELRTEPEEVAAAAGADERVRFRSRSVHRRTRSHSPFRPHWLSPSSPEHAGDPETAPSASRSSSSSSTVSSASSSSSSSSSHHRRWRFLKDLLYRSKSDGGGKHHPPPHSPPPPPAASKGNLSPSAARGRGGRSRSSAHARLYEARRAEAEEMRRRTFLPYRQGLLLGCLGLSSRGYGAMHGLAATAGAAKFRA